MEFEDGAKIEHLQPHFSVRHTLEVLSHRMGRGKDRGGEEGEGGEDGGEAGKVGVVGGGSGGATFVARGI